MGDFWKYFSQGVDTSVLCLGFHVCVHMLMACFIAFSSQKTQSEEVPVLQYGVEVPSKELPCEMFLCQIKGKRSLFPHLNYL